MGKTRASGRQYIFALFGVVAPILYAATVIILGLLWSVYNPFSQVVSELGAVGAPHAPILGASFVAVGLLLVGFALGLHLGIPAGRTSYVAPLLIAIFGSAIVAQSFFPCPPGCVDDGSFTAAMHGLTGLIGFIAIVFAPFFLFWRLKAGEAWKTYASLSLAVGLATPAGFVVSLLSDQLGLTEWIGALQRLRFGIVFLWILLLALRLLSLSRPPSSSAQSA